MAERRKLRGKKLLVATVSLAGAGASLMAGCGDAPVANLVPPPPQDATLDAVLDAMEETRMDAVVANLVAPPPPDATPEASPTLDSGSSE